MRDRLIIIVSSLTSHTHKSQEKEGLMNVHTVNCFFNKILSRTINIEILCICRHLAIVHAHLIAVQSLWFTVMCHVIMN